MHSRTTLSKLCRRATLRSGPKKSQTKHAMLHTLEQPTPKGGEMCTLWFALFRLSPNRFSRRSWRTRRTSRSRLVFGQSKCDTARNNPRPAYSSNARTSNTNDNVKLFDVRIAASSIPFCRDFASQGGIAHLIELVQISVFLLLSVNNSQKEPRYHNTLKQILGFTGTRTDILCPVVESNFRSSSCGLD